MTKKIFVYPIKLKLPHDGNPSAVSLPLMAALVEMNSELVLIDTGFPLNSELVDQLALLHFDPDDISTIINTHSHADHVGGNHFFPNARIIASKIDYNYLRDYSYALINTQNAVEVVSRFFPHSNSRRLDETAQHALLLAKKYWRDDILGSPDAIDWIEDKCPLPAGITIIPTPGHTPGHLSVQISGESQQFIVAGDALPSRLFWKRRLQELAPRFSSKQFLRSKSKIESMHGIIMGGHDIPFLTSNMNYVDKKRIIL
jgi:glyoxylase-like metal-dependent hydrolase (beta-lactamase superfamily II)